MVMLPSVYTAKSYGLFVDGLDVLKEPAVPARYGVPTDSIRVTEAGPGGVSSMSFAIDDPSVIITIAAGAEIRFWDMDRNLPVFLGHLQSLAYRPDFGQQGRTIEVEAFGIESLLDTVVVPTLTSTSGDQATSNANWLMFDGAMLQIIGSHTGLRTGGEPGVGVGELPCGSKASSLAYPIGRTDSGGEGRNTLLATFPSSVVMNGQSVRQAFESFRASCSALVPNTSVSVPPYPVFLSVDFWGGIRLFLFGGGDTSWLPTDYATLTISDTPSGALAAEDIGWQEDYSPGSIVNAVFVNGAAADSTGWVVGDTTLGRYEGSATTTGTTEKAKQAAAGPVMIGRQNAAGRGSLSLTSYTPTNVHPGSRATITDARVGFAAKACLVTQIVKTMNSDGTQNWDVSFIAGGGTPTAGAASAMERVRTLTRAVL